jgi:hypothetical protein
MTVGRPIAAALGIIGLVMFALVCGLAGYVIHDDGPPVAAPAPQTIALTTTTAPAASATSTGSSATNPASDATEPNRVNHYEGGLIRSARRRSDSCQGAKDCLKAVRDLAVMIYWSTGTHTADTTRLRVPDWLPGRSVVDGIYTYTFHQIAANVIMVTRVP